MRNWKFLLTSQLLRGNWFLHVDHAMAGLADVEQLLYPGAGLETVTQDLSERNPYQLNYFTESSSGLLLADTSESSGSAFDSLPKGSVAVFSVTGTLLKYGTWCSYGTEEIAAFMIEAANHPNVSGAFIIADSGGGAVNAVAPFRYAIETFKANKKPVLAHIDGAYSAMYYAIASADEIVAANNISAGAGSIGVMMSWVDMKGKIEKEGGKFHTIYAPESSEKNKAMELALEGKYDLIKTEMLSPLAVQFQNDVKADRGIKLKDDGKVLKGKTYFAQQAIEVGLIDSIGNQQQAIESLNQRIAINKFLTSK